MLMNRMHEDQSDNSSLIEVKVQNEPFLLCRAMMNQN